jgi:hypothetical protein
MNAREREETLRTLEQSESEEAKLQRHGCYEVTVVDARSRVAEATCSARPADASAEPTLPALELALPESAASGASRPRLDPDPLFVFPSETDKSASIVFGPDVVVPVRPTVPNGGAHLPSIPGAVPPRISLYASNLVVITPPPQHLNPDDKPCRWAALLASWYLGAVEAAYPGKTFWPLKRGPVARSPYYRDLCDAARLFLELGINPGIWILFSLDAWREHAADRAAKKPPSVAWVFSPKRIRERQRWYDDDAKGREHMRAAYTPSGREFLQKQARMEYGLRRLHARGTYNEATALQVVRNTFPDRDALLARVRVEVREQQAEVDADVRNGKWVWG